jgi:hypothetical protein
VGLSGRQVFVLNVSIWDKCKAGTNFGNKKADGHHHPLLRAVGSQVKATR